MVAGANRHALTVQYGGEIVGMHPLCLEREDRALAGCLPDDPHPVKVFDGYCRNHGKEDAKRAVAAILARMNAGEALGRDDIERELKPFMA